MPAYSVPIVRPICRQCWETGGGGRPATVEVRNRFNETVGFRCTRHGKLLVDKLNSAVPDDAPQPPR